MPWRECDAVSERMTFVSRLLAGERMSDVCREFGISRKTGYKIFQRYKSDGVDGLKNQNRAARSRPNRTSRLIEDKIVALREDHKTWGAPKIKAMLERSHPKSQVPACSTIHAILQRHDLIQKRVRQRGYRSTGTELIKAGSSNELWCTDFKGQFRMGNREYCYPLTITDQFSRYLIACEGMERIRDKECVQIFEEIFHEFGVPSAIRSDNGVPFASKSYFGLSRLSLYWVKLGIRLERIKPGHPEQNGAHERMHRTLDEAIIPPAPNLLQQQEKFDCFRDVFNNERPHQAIEMQSPVTLYQVSQKRPDPKISDGNHQVRSDGTLYLENKKRLYIGEIFAGEKVDVTQVDEDVSSLKFLNYTLGFFDERDPKLEIGTNPFLI